MANARTRGRVAKGKVIDVRPCRACNHLYSLNKSRCPECGALDLLGDAKPPVTRDNHGVVFMDDIEDSETRRIGLIGDLEPLNKVFGGAKRTGEPGNFVYYGGGIPITGCYLLGGEPGAGKSTIALQIADSIATTECTKPEDMILYVSAEQANKELRDTARRLCLKNLNKRRIGIFPMGADWNTLGDVIWMFKPKALFIDSVPYIIDTPEDAVQWAKQLKACSVALECPSFIIDHVTKGAADFAGLEKLQHAVDALVLMSGEGNNPRDFYMKKNRFGRSGWDQELRMTETGLVCVGETQIDEGSDENEGKDEE